MKAIHIIYLFIGIFIIIHFFVDKGETNKRKCHYEIVRGSPSSLSKSLLKVKVSLKEGNILNNEELRGIPSDIFRSYGLKVIEHLYIDFYLYEMDLFGEPYAKYGLYGHYEKFNGVKTLVLEPEVRLFKKPLFGTKYEKLIAKCKKCKWYDQ